jgi:hypothetical protein
LGTEGFIKIHSLGKKTGIRYAAGERVNASTPINKIALINRDHVVFVATSDTSLIVCTTAGSITFSASPEVLREFYQEFSEGFGSNFVSITPAISTSVVHDER